MIFYNLIIIKVSFIVFIFYSNDNEVIVIFNCFILSYYQYHYQRLFQY